LEKQSNSPASSPNLARKSQDPSTNAGIPQKAGSVIVETKEKPKKEQQSQSESSGAEGEPKKPLDPRSAAFNEAEYKQKMLEAYERQQAENAEILRKRKEREAQGLPPVVEIPHVPERPRRNTIAQVPDGKKKKRLWWKKG